MHIGLKVPNWGQVAGPEAVMRTALAAEERGFGSVWVSDHVAIPAAKQHAGAGAAGLDPRTPFLDPLTTLAYVAGRTERVQLGTGVFVLPLRHPVVVAKEVSTVDVLSHGRLLFGVGVGWMREEFDLLDSPFGDRGRRTDAAIATMRDCWAPADEETAVQMHPRPARRVPILVGGTADRALQRTVRLADGWYGSGLTVEAFAEVAAELGRRMAAEAPTERLLVGTRVADVDPGDAPGVVADFASAGADFVILDATHADPAAAAAWVHRTADALDLDPAGCAPLASGRGWAGHLSRPLIPDYYTN